jgi:hypothetical protein
MNRSCRARRVAGTGLVAMLAGLAACYAAPAADAALTAFTLAPHSGPPGTVVQASGTGCNPGLVGSAQTDFVSVTAPTLRVVVQIPVHANGTWAGSFTVPANADAGRVAVGAVCVTGGFPTLTTTYSPQTFTVTASPPTTPGTSTTRPGSSTTSTNPPHHPSTTVFVPDHPTVVVGAPSTSPPVTADTAGTSPGGAGTIAGSHETSTSSRGPGKVKGSAAAGSATLAQADLGSYFGTGGDGGLGWLSWLLLLALLVAAGAATMLIRRARRARRAAIHGETP